MREDLAVVGELELAADQTVRELARLDRERTDVAGDLVAFRLRRIGVIGAAEHDLEHTLDRSATGGQ